MTSAAFLAAAAIKSNLAFAFWGAAFLLLILLCLSGAAFEALRAARRLAADPAGLSFRASLPGRGLWFPGEGAAFRKASPLKAAALPWISLEFLRVYEAEAGGKGRPRRFSVSAPAASPEAERVLAAPGRGRWASGEFRVRVRDALGMAAWEWTIPEADEFAVAPEPLAFGLRPPSGGGGPDKSNPESFRRSEELLDSRKYHPGDDARRINWKQYGHSGELFIRIGEREPPPKARYLVAVDPAAPPGSPPGTAAACAEAVVALAAGCALELAARGSRVTLAAPGKAMEDEGQGGGDEAAAAKAILSFLAGVGADDGSAPLALPPDREARGAQGSRGLILFCAPFSPRSEALLAALSGAGPMAVVPLLGAGASAGYWKTLFMRDRGGRSAVPGSAAVAPWAARRYDARASLYAERLRRTSNVDARAL